MRISELTILLTLAATPALAEPKAPGAATVRDGVRAWRSAHEREVLRELMDLLRIPNLASDGPNIRLNAEQVATLLEKRGVKTRLLDGEGGPPVVYGERTVSGAARTVVVYAHYDGQPVDPSRWTSDPWTPVLRDGPLEAGGRPVSLDSVIGPLPGEWRLYGRSTSDDKAPVVGLAAALDALDSARIPLSVNLKVFFEGEEEAGSPHLEAVLRRNAELLKADLWLLCDGPVHQSRRMQLYFGARGIADLEVTVYGAARALHSGHYGNWAPNPAAALAHLLAGLRAPDGRILVAGFHDDVRPATDAERAALAAVPDVDEELREALAFGASEGGLRLVESVMRPALNVRGVESGGVGARAANAVPTEARASIDFRLVPDQTPAKVRERVEAHLRSLGWHVVHEAPDPATRRAHPRVVKLEWGPGYPSARTPLDSPASRATLTVVSEARGEPALALPTLGGSIPMHLFGDVLGAPVVGVPIANHDNSQHAADENIRLQNLWDGIEVYAALLARLGPALGR